MKYLHVHAEDSGIFEQTDVEADSEVCELIDQQQLDIFKFENGAFMRAVVTSEEIQENEDDEDSVVETFSIDHWEVV